MKIKNKEYWYITDKGDLDIDIDENKYKDKFRRHIVVFFSKFTVQPVPHECEQNI